MSMRLRASEYGARMFRQELQDDTEPRVWIRAFEVKDSEASERNWRELAAVISTRRAVWSCLAHMPDLYISD